jgi:transposase InsO family protein
MILQAKPEAKFQIINEMVNKEGNKLSVSMLCNAAGVSRTGYYYWLNAEGTRKARETADEADFALILWAYSYRGFDKGVMGIKMRLHRHPRQVNMNEKKIRRLMRKYGLECPIRKANPYRRMAKGRKESDYAKNLVERQFREFGSRMVLLTDVTYLLKKSNGKWTYLSVIMDAFTKQILSFTLSESLEVDFVLVCVSCVIEGYGHEITEDTMLHSDQGVHYTSDRFIELVTNAELRRSMSRKANCWDNAPQESLFGHMKDEIRFEHTDTHEDIVAKITDWVDYYNADRPQNGLFMLTPDEYYEYVKTGAYPLPIAIPKPRVYKKKAKTKIQPDS